MNFDLAEIRSQMRPGWSPVNIIIMVLLFWIFWPFGLAMVAYIVWGDRIGLDFSQPNSFRGFAGRLKQGLSAAIDGFNGKNNHHPHAGFGSTNTGTPAPEKEDFEQWRQREQDKLKSERAALDRDKKAFDDARKMHEESD